MCDKLLKSTMYISGMRSYLMRKYVTREMSHLSKILNYHFLTPLSHNVKMLHFDANPITIGYLVAEL